MQTKVVVDAQDGVEFKRTPLHLAVLLVLAKADVDAQQSKAAHHWIQRWSTTEFKLRH